MLFSKLSKSGVSWLAFFHHLSKVASGDDIVANALIVKLEQRLVVNQNVATAGLVLQLFDFRAQLQVSRKKA